MPKKLHIALILDKSSSMAGTKAHTISGFNEQVAQIRLNAKEPGAPETTATLVTFNGDVFEHLLMAPVEQLEEANPEFYKPEGMTAMLDAMGYTLKKIKAAAGPEDDILITTISDGDENSSKHFNASQLREEVMGLQATGHWTFSYMGCSATSLQHVNQTTGIPVSNMANWSNASGGASKRAMVGTAGAIGRFMRSKAANPDQVLVENLYTDDKDKYMDFASAVDGEARCLADAVADEGLVGSAGLAPTRGGQHTNSSRGMRSRSFAGGPQIASLAAVPTSAPVVDRPEDLEIRAGTSDLFAKGAKASW